MTLLRNRAFTDAAILAVMFVACYAYFSSIEAFELLVEFMEAHEDWELDEAITSLMLAGTAGFIYAIRRYNETRSELKKRKKAEASVGWLAQNDALTELPNRRFLNSFLGSFDAKGADNNDTRYGVLSIDLDGFKGINDLHGHAAGDALLKTVARRLSTVAEDDLIVRLGGDEFLVIAETSSDRDVEQLAKRLVDAVSKPMNLDGVHAEVGVSIGYLSYPAQAPTMADAVRSADIAMYGAKKNGGNAIMAFSDDMRDEAAARAKLEHDLKAAIRQGDIVPFYQPLIDLEADRIRGFEVLARWTLPSGEAVPPSVFIPLAEQMGLITDLSEQLLRTACRDAKAWPSDVGLSFNLSPTQLSDRLIGLRIITILKDFGLPPSRLEIEITESAMIQDGDSALAVIADLKAAGVRTALDDFGTGYSSLSQVARFNFDRIKIDRSFVNELDNEKQRNIVKAIIALGDGLDVSTTAEGIETDDQLNVLKSLGCGCGQGFLLGRPVDAEKTGALFTRTDETEHPLLAQAS